MPTYRPKRVGELLLGFLAEKLTRLTDPRVQLVTLTAVEVSPDLRAAKVYWTVPATDSTSSTLDFASDEIIREVGSALKSSEKFFRKKIGDELELRNVPELTFLYDRTLVNASRIDSLLDQVRRENENLG